MVFYFLLLLVTVMVVTAMAVISVVRVVYQCWLLSTIVPIACLLSWHFDQRPFNLQMSLSLLGLTIVLLFVGHWVSQSFSELTRSSLEKQAMNEEFSTLSENLKERNFQLQQLRDQLAEMATVDELTGLRNRRGGNQLLEIELDRAKRSHVPLAVVAVDVDCFKQYNDTYGHPSGDRVLQRVAQTLLSTTSRAGEAAIRMGGEEFLLVLPGADGDDAMKTAGLVRQRLEASAIAHGASTVASHLTVSLGVVSCIPEVKTKVDDLLAGADQALYESKSQGRDRATLGRIGV
jgi:diguanylate cyclase (GGDEF)-like protein